VLQRFYALPALSRFFDMVVQVPLGVMQLALELAVQLLLCFRASMRAQG
jgi:hypothetical protein